MGKSEELVTGKSNEAIVRRYSDVIAKSPLDIKRGEMVFLDKHGAAMGRGRFSRLVGLWRFGMLGTMIGGAGLALTGAWLPGAALYITGAMPLIIARYRGSPALMAIDVIIRQGHLDEAQRRFDAVPHLRRRSPAAYGMIAGNLASHRGDYAGALKWWREAFPRTNGLAREILKMSITKALLLDDKLVEAQRSRDDTKLPPDADAVLTSQVLERVMFALHDPRAQLSVEALHDLARSALEYSHTGVDLAAIGLAFERAGEDDMAQWLATEAIERMHYPYLATWWPALQQWLDARTKPPATTD